MPRKHHSDWDLAVFAFMAGGISWAYAGATLAESIANDALRLALHVSALVAAFGSLAVFYARFVEPFWITVTRRTVALPECAGLRIAVIGDYHVGPYKRDAFVAKSVAVVNKLKPDLVFLVGDFLYNAYADVEHLAPLGNLKARLGVFAVTGNHDASSDHMPGDKLRARHDRTDDLERFLAQHNVRFLRNASIAVQHRDATVHIAGIDDIWSKSCDLRTALANVPRGEPCVLLSHNPDIILDPMSHRAQLIVSGHTHAGQVRLPWIGSLHPLPQRLSKKFDRGIFEITPKCRLAITHGIGETFVPLRFLTRPEVMLLEAK